MTFIQGKHSYILCSVPEEIQIMCLFGKKSNCESRIPSILTQINPGLRCPHANNFYVYNLQTYKL